MAWDSHSTWLLLLLKVIYFLYIWIHSSKTDLNERICTRRPLGRIHVPVDVSRRWGILETNMCRVSQPPLPSVIRHCRDKQATLSSSSSASSSSSSSSSLFLKNESVDTGTEIMPFQKTEKVNEFSNLIFLSSWASGVEFLPLSSFIFLYVILFYLTLLYFILTFLILFHLILSCFI